MTIMVGSVAADRQAVGYSSPPVGEEGANWE